MINFLCEHNEHNFIAAFHYKPKHIIFIQSLDSKNDTDLTEVTQFLSKKMPDVDIESCSITYNNLQPLNELLTKYKNEEIIFNVSESEGLFSILIYQLLNHLQYKVVSVDLYNKKIIQLTSTEISEAKADFAELSIKDFIDFTGGRIVTDASVIYGTDEYIEIVDLLVKNYEIWKSVKKLLRDNDYVIQSIEQPLWVQIKNMTHLPQHTIKNLMNFCNILLNRKLIIKLDRTTEKISLLFRDIKIKNFIFIAGTWLEALTYRVIKEMQEIDDVKYGVRFLWDQDIVQVENELDVLATIQSSLVCISCKDTSHYDVAQLNELEVYAQKLGGQEVKKILVATSEPKRNSLFNRAEEMKIHIIVFDGDIKAFSDSLNKIIKS